MKTRSSSADENTRPAAGFTPSMLKKLPETSSASTRSVWLSTASDASTGRRAITSANGAAFCWKSAYIGYEFIR